MAIEISDDTMADIAKINSCGYANDHRPEWHVSMTSPEGNTGITLRKCTACMLSLIHTPAVIDLGRTVHLRRVT